MRAVGWRYVGDKCRGGFGMSEILSPREERIARLVLSFLAGAVLAEYVLVLLALVGVVRL